MRRNFQHLFALLLALIASFTLIQLASAAILVTRAELNGGELRLEGEGAVPGATILVDGIAMGAADDGGEFRIERDGFNSPTCVVTVSDGSSEEQALLDGCSPSVTNTPTPGNSPTATNTSAPTNTPTATNTPLPTDTPAPTNTPTNTPPPTDTPPPSDTPAPSATSAPDNQPPIADAGPDQTVEDSDEDGVETVTLDGSSSSDPDGSIVSYEWRVDGQLMAAEGSSVTIASLNDSGPQLAIAESSTLLLGESLDSGGPDFMVESNQPDPETVIPAGFGGPLAAAGDVNSDGFEDIIVGAPGWDGGLSHEGAAFVFHGNAGGVSGTSPSTANAHIESNQFGAQLGTVAAAGDVNGDGFDDIIVGAHFYDSVLPGTNLAVDGAAFVFHGGPQGITGSDPATADATILGNELNSDLGVFVSSAGDVNGDGFDDIIVGVPNHGTPFPDNIPPNDRSGDYGAALLFYGSPEGITGTGFDDADAVLLSYEDTGEPEPPIYGRIRSVAGVGDVNGDGFDDVVLGGTELALFLGSPIGIPTGNLTTADARVQPNPSSQTLFAAAAGDVNGDGFHDVMASAPFRDLEPESTREEGAAYLFLGGSTGISATDTSQAHATFTGNMLAEWVGLSISSAGDVDNDGFDDILVGAHEYPGSLESEGVAYLFRGSLQGISGQSLLDADARLEVRQSMAIRHSNVLAFGVAGAGDVNGDGFDDVLVGKGYYDNGEANEGAAFGFLGHTWPSNPNQPPVANAGADQSVVDVDNSGTAPVVLDGSASFDPDGTIASYAWYKGETLLGTTPALQTELPVLGDQELVLVVTDDQGVSRGDPLTVRVEPPQRELIYSDAFSNLDGWATSGDVSLSNADSFPTPPQARLGSTGAIMSRSMNLPTRSTGMQLRFWGKASQFAAGDEVRVNVSVDGGPFQNLLTVTGADSDDAYHFYGGSGAVLSLSWYPATASNIVLAFESATSSGQFFVDDITVHALMAPPGTSQAPVADAGPDQSVSDDDGDGLATVVLDGSASFDPDGTIVSYQWHESGTLLGNTASLATELAVGEHVLTLTVTDNEGLTAVDTVAVTIVPSSPQPDSQITLSLPVGVHTIELTVTDDDGATATDTVVVTVNGSAPPSTPEATLDINAPSSAERGDFVDINMSVTNTGNDTLQGLSLSIGWSPSNRLKDLSDPSTVSLGDIAPGQSASFNWRVRADRQGTVEISGTATIDGATLTSSTRSMQILR